MIELYRTILNKEPDVIIRDCDKETCVLIDTGISGDRNVIKTAAEKVLKYKGRGTEMQCVCVCVWYLKTEMVPVIIWVTRTITK
jgi:hypothetical protein